MAAPTFRQLKDEYAALWHSMIVKPDKHAVLFRIAKKLIAGKPRYQAVAAKTGVPWAAIALIHQMDAAATGRSTSPRATRGTGARCMCRRAGGRSTHGRTPRSMRWRSTAPTG